MTDPDELRDRIAEQVTPFVWSQGDTDAVLAVVMPVVREAVAAELDAAADEWDHMDPDHRNVPRWLYDRADRWRAGQ